MVVDLVEREAGYALAPERRVELIAVELAAQAAQAFDGACPGRGAVGHEPRRLGKIDAA